MDNKNTLNIIKKELDDKISYQEENVIVINDDSLSAIKRIPDHSIALILTDPPYHSTKKKNITGDTDFTNNREYIKWMEMHSNEWKRILKPNGSVFCFCSSEMSPWLQVMFNENFNVLSEIVWTKPNAPGYDGWKQKMKKESLRKWYPHSERIVFMEPAFEGNLYRSFFGSKLKEWRKKSKITMHYLAEITESYGKVNHGGAVSNWEAGRNIPSKQQYEKIIDVLSRHLIDEEFPIYEDIIRPFHMNGSIEFTDVWDFENVRQYKGKHPAEKPLDLLKHAILSSTYKDDIVLDCFSGSGATGVAALELNRKAICIEIEEKWAKYSIDKIRNRENTQLRLKGI